MSGSVGSGEASAVDHQPPQATGASPGADEPAGSTSGTRAGVGLNSSGPCPTCGEVRLGSFRYCRKCGLDYETASTFRCHCVVATIGQGQRILDAASPTCGNTCASAVARGEAGRSADHREILGAAWWHGPGGAPHDGDGEPRDPSGRATAPRYVDGLPVAGICRYLRGPSWTGTLPRRTPIR